jgi:N-methylhydantoinase A
VIVPYGAGVGSAIGLLEAEPRIDVTTTRIMRIDAASSGGEVARLYQALKAQALGDARRISAQAKPQWSRYAQMRYAGQGFEIHVDLPPGPIDASYTTKIIAAFNEAYRRKHKFLDPEGIVEAVDWTLVATLPSRPDAAVIGHPPGAAQGRRAGTRRAWFPQAGGYTETPIIDRSGLANGATLAGPAIVEDPDCTTLIQPGDVARMSPLGHIIVDIARETSR